MITVNYEQAHLVVQNNKFLRWDGWDIVDFKADSSAEFDKNGVRFKNRWGFEKRFTPDHEGWKVPKRYVR
jgi:hypothetical protein